jgi:hypothetical protein
MKEDLARRVILGLESKVPHPLRSVGKLSDARPGLLVVRDDELVHPGRDHVSLHAVRIGEQHESLLARRGRRRIQRGLRPS